MEGLDFGWFFIVGDEDLNIVRVLVFVLAIFAIVIADIRVCFL